MGRRPIGIMGNQRKPIKSFFVVIVVSGIARGRVRSTHDNDDDDDDDGVAQHGGHNRNEAKFIFVSFVARPHR